MISLAKLLCGLLTYVISQERERERVLKTNKLWKTFVCICLLYVHDENQDMLMQQKRLYIFYLP